MDQYSGLIFGLILIIIIVMSLSVHEFAHAYVANLFGDPTAKLEGRLTLNPRAHWDPVGTTILVALLVLRALGLGGLPAFGWGKPVPVNEDNFDNPRLYGIQTALAGPMSNFIIALFFALLVRYIQLPELIGSIFVVAIYINIFLMFFNLLPIPPLDGSSVLRLFMSRQSYYALAGSPFFLFGVIFVIFYFLSEPLVMVTNYLTGLLIGS